MRNTPLVPLLLSALLAGCASSYTSPRKRTLSWHGGDAAAAIALEYDYNAMRAAGNGKYARSAASLGLEIPAVRIKNNTDRVIVVKKDLDFTVGGALAEPSEPGSETAGIRQMTGAYAWWMTLVTVNIFSSKTECSGYGGCESKTSFIPVGLILGPLITGINCGVSSSSNTAFKGDVEGHNLLNATLKPGETATGFLVFRDVQGGRPIAARLRQAAPMAPAVADSLEAR